MLTTSCGIFKKSNVQSEPYDAAQVALDHPDVKAPDNAVIGLLPFTVDRPDGFYEVIEFTEPYPFTNVVLAEHPVVAKSEIDKAKASVDAYSNYPTVAIELTKEGGRKFEKATADNWGKPLAIVIGGKVISMPVIQGIIGGGKVQISGLFSTAEAEEMVKTLLKK